MKLPELVECGRKGCGHKAKEWSIPCPDDGCIRLKVVKAPCCWACMATMTDKEGRKLVKNWPLFAEKGKK